MKAAILICLGIAVLVNVLNAAPMLGADQVDQNAAASRATGDDDDAEMYDPESANDNFGYLDLDDADDDEDVEHRRRRHAHCWHQCVIAGQCHRRHKEFEDEVDAAGRKGNKTCASKVVRCDSCILDCKALSVKCAADAMKLKVQDVRYGSEKLAVAALCDKCNLRQAASKCKPKPHTINDLLSGFADLEDDNRFLWTIFDEFEGEDNTDDEQPSGDDKADFFARQQQAPADDNDENDDDDDDENDEDVDSTSYNVTDDLEGRWRPHRRCRIPVKRMSAKKRQAICAASKCFVQQAQAQTACQKNAVPVLTMYKNAFDKILNCKQFEDDDEDDDQDNTVYEDDDFEDDK